MIFKRVILSLVLAAAGGASADARSGADGPSVVSLRFQANVPVICQVELSAALGEPDADGLAPLGTAREFCNAPGGYRVVIRHPADLEGAAVIADGVRIPLSPAGETVITNADRPASRTVALAADVGDEPGRFRSISVRIEAKV